MADQIADGHAAERSFDRELRDHVLSEGQFGHSLLAPILYLNSEARRARLIRRLSKRPKAFSFVRLSLRISLRSPLDQGMSLPCPERGVCT